MASYRLSFVLNLASILGGLVTFYFMSRLVGNHSSVARYGGYLPFAVVGIAMSSFFSVGFTSFSTVIRQEQLMGTLESIMMTPVRLTTLILSSSAWAFAWSLITTMLTLVLSIVVFGIRIHGNWGLALLLIALTTVTFCCLGIVSASFTIVFKQGDPVRYLAGSVSFLLGGVVFPVSELPGWLQKISAALPMTHGITGVRDVLLRGADIQTVWPQLLFLTLFSAAGLPLSLMSFRKAVKIGRREGSLLHY
jgi:ABC-2 type transport system permease protein